MSDKPFHYHRRVVFSDCDMAGCVHFSRLLEILEEAEQSFYRNAKVPWITPKTAWPRIRIECNYRSPAYIDEILTIFLSIATVGTSHLEWDFRVIVTETEERIIADGRIVTCYVTREEHGIHSSPILPDDLQKLKATC